MNVTSVTVLICTFNRARLLRETLAALNAMAPANAFGIEIIVVDNNSADNTSLVVAEAARSFRVPVIALRESRQGKSFALNRGLQAASGDVVALTDDDVWPDCQWLNRIVSAFRQRDITFVFGKVLPRWGGLPPPELLIPKAQEIWGPLAIVDYGDEPIEYLEETTTGQRLPIGANLAMARQALVTIGGWRTDLGKVNNTLISGEDHEIFMRLRRFSLYSGFYDPDIVVRHFVPAARLTRAYFRRWFFWHGKTQALMLDDLYPELEMARVPRVCGTPRFLLRQGIEQFGKWMHAMWRGDPLQTLIEELRSLDYAGFFAECWKQRRAPQTCRAHPTSTADVRRKASPAQPMR